MLRALRLAVLRSNLGPMRAVHEGVYRLAAQTAVRALRARFPERFEAVYLRGSLAMGPLVPAISDVDLFAILHDETTPEEHRAVKAAYARMAERVPLFDPAPWILRRTEVGGLHRTNPSVRFRVLEGRQAFTLLHGRDVLAELPEPTGPQVSEALLSDLKSRLTYFNRFCLAPGPRDELERLRREYLLFKLTVDLARVDLFLTSGTLLFRRRDVLDRAPSVGGPLLEEFVRHTLRSRLRRSFPRVRRIPLEDLERDLLQRCIELLRRFHDRADVRDSDTVTAGKSHFYAKDVFLPTGRPVEYVTGAILADYATLKRRVLESHTTGTDVVLRHAGLLIDFSNADPSIGHCTVVTDSSDRAVSRG